MAAEERRPRGRRRSRTPEQIHEAMVEAGLDLIRDSGLVVTLDTVRFEDAVEAANLPRASAYRAWQDDDADEGPQVRFQDRIVALLLRTQAGGGDDEALAATMEAAAELLPGPGDNLATWSADERRSRFRAIIRAGTETNLDQLRSNRLWLAYVSLACSLASQTAVPDELHQAAIEGDERMAERYVPLYEAVMGTFGLRLRSCYTWANFATAMAAAVEGLAAHGMGDGRHQQGIERRTGPNGELESWSLFSVMAEALISHMFEPIPKVRHATLLKHED